MKDILLNRDGDIALTDEGDIQIVRSPIQAALIKWKWYLGEWVFDPTKGIPWYETVLIKNPNTDVIRQIFIRELLDIDDVTEVLLMEININKPSRTAIVHFRFRTTKMVFEEEVMLHG